MKRGRKGKKSLLGLVLLLGVGFASIATTLYISGTANITNADFEVIFTAADVDGTDITSTGISQSGTEITYTTSDLTSEGDDSVLNFTVKNNSPMYDATVSISCTANGANSEYYTVAPLIDGSSSTTIEAMHTKDGTVTVTLDHASINTISETFTCTLNATATERTTVGEEPVTGFQPTYYAFGDPTTSSTTDYTTLNKNVFVGLDTQGNKGVCINRSGTVHCFQSGAATVSYEQQHVQELFNQPNQCSYVSGPDIWDCRADDFGCVVGIDGNVECFDDDPLEGCSVSSVGYVNCY